MDHIRRIDWCNLQKDSTNFLEEEDLDNCVTEKILRGKFTNPLLSSDSEDERPEINWKEVFAKDENDKNNSQTYVPGLKPLPRYPKVSTLTQQQHYQMLKTLCAENPSVLESFYFPRPMRNDHKSLAVIAPIYELEQIEYKNWAKTLWISGHNVRALRPRPTVEQLYNAFLDVHFNSLTTVPKHYEMVAHIPLETNNQKFDFTCQKDLIKVPLAQLPKLEYPSLTTKYTIMRNHPPLPKVCLKHPCRFLLPNEDSVTTLSMMQVRHKLSQYAADNGAQYIISENAAKCLVEQDRCWMVPVTVCPVLGSDGEVNNVYVIGNEITNRMEPARRRTYLACRSFLELAFITPQERLRVRETIRNSIDKSVNNSFQQLEITDSSSDDDDNLVIDMDAMETDSMDKVNTNSKGKRKSSNNFTTKDILEDTVQCTCKDTFYEKPARRSFKKWRIKCKTTKEVFTVIIHNSHKARNLHSEVILEPIPEYQLDLGGTVQSPEKLRSLALSLHLRPKSTLVNVHIDASTGDLVSYAHHDLEELQARHGRPLEAAAAALHAALTQLQGLRPAEYLLQHERKHGGNALLYVGRPRSGAADCIALEPAPAPPPSDREMAELATPPALGPVLLPYHKYRKILPLAFTPFPYQVYTKPPKHVVKMRHPPQAIKLGSTETGATSDDKKAQWPKKRQRKRRHHQI